MRRWRHALRGTVCAVLAIALQMLPLEVRPAPDAEPLLGTPPAAAQSHPQFSYSVTPGSPSSCRSTNGIAWSPSATGSECEIELPACPASPLHTTPGVFMRLSSPPVGLDTSRFPSGFKNVDEYSYDANSGEADLDDYPDFCELRVTWDDPLHRTNCAADTSHVVRTYHHNGPTPLDEDCRLLRPLACPDGLQFATSKTCRGIERRTWSCTLPAVRHNTFGDCITATTYTGGTNPACATNWPPLPLSSCEVYVGGDYIQNPPPSADCTTNPEYTSGTRVLDISGSPAIPTALQWPLSNVMLAPTLGVPATVTDHWCEYDVRALRPECHGAASHGGIPRPSECGATGTAQPAWCIKRASEVGGCAAIAETIRCRAFEQAFVETPTTVPLDYVRSQGCSPCLALPFRPIPPRCPPDTRGSAEIGFYAYRLTDQSYVRLSEHPQAKRAHDVQRSPDDTECEDPPAGWLRESPTHSSGLAVVNTAVVVAVDGLNLEQLVPYDLETIGYVAGTHRTGTSRDGEVRYIATNPGPQGAEVPMQVRFAGGDPDSDQRIKTWLDPDPGQGPYPFLHDVTEATECVAASGPTFRLIVRELWPDRGGAAFTAGDPSCAPMGSQSDEAAQIWDLFDGLESLSWWCGLDDDQRRRATAARGIEWWSDFRNAFPNTTAGLLDAERARDVKMTTEVPCAFGIPITRDRRPRQPDPQGSGIWCHWVPQRPGYYRLHAGGVWDMRKSGGVEDRTPTPFMQEIEDFFNNPDPLPWDPAKTWGQLERENAQAQFGRWTNSGLLNRDWGSLGLNFVRLDAPLGPTQPLSPDDLDRILYEQRATSTGCPSLDLRIFCNTEKDIFDYTETDPIGVIVYEARVVTRAPS